MLVSLIWVILLFGRIMVFYKVEGVVLMEILIWMGVFDLGWMVFSWVLMKCGVVLVLVNMEYVVCRFFFVILLVISMVICWVWMLVLFGWVNKESLLDFFILGLNDVVFVNGCGVGGLMLSLLVMFCVRLVLMLVSSEIICLCIVCVCICVNLKWKVLMICFCLIVVWFF